jgi:GT2 family glycosyltransferase
MDLSIIVVSFNTRDLLRACLASIPPATAGLRCETIVVDNASGDGSAEMTAADFPEVVLIRNAENRGFAAANNQALAISRGRYALLLNSDAALLTDTVPALVRFMEAHPRCGLVGGQLLNPDGSFQASYADFPTLGGELLLMTTLARLCRPASYPSYPAEQSQQPRAVDWVLRRAGWTVNYLPAAKVVHWSGQSANRVPEQKRSRLYRSKWLFMRKHYGPLTALAFRQAVRWASVLKCAVAWGRVVASNGERRQVARQQLRSHRLVLAEL